MTYTFTDTLPTIVRASTELPLTWRDNRCNRGGGVIRSGGCDTSTGTVGIHGLITLTAAEPITTLQCSVSLFPATPPPTHHHDTTVAIYHSQS
ncbi:hypothetical protein J6590_008822 [Homalodisca vitripennis]|nr:hypothetical protein J6590_008822 [Homalodisca vitripennis]